MSRQAIKYQTTVIDPWKSAGEIAALVRKYGGSRFEQRWGESGELLGIRFAIRDERLGEVPVILGAQTERIETILRKSTTWPHQRIHEQAQRIAWRQLKDFVEQALLAVETGLFPLAAAFMAHMEMQDEETGQPIALVDYMQTRGRIGPAGHGVRLLPSGTGNR